MNFLGFGQSADIDIVFDGAENRKFAEIKTDDGKKEKYLLYYDGETVSGKVNLTLKKPGSKLEQQGIKIELIGQIELYYDRGNHYEFLSLVRELARPGDLIQNMSYPFEFANVEKPYEVYAGSNVRLRYFLRVTIVRRLSDIIKEVDIAVHTLSSYPELNSPIKMEVGIEDCLHIEFEYNKCKYHLKDVIVGKIYFLLVRIKIKHMEIAIIKREQTGSGPNIFTENEIIAKYEIMDGAPVKGESIPIRVFLAGYDLTPTMREINKKFSVRYFLNLVLMDTEDRRYFKQQEITLWRKSDKARKPVSSSSALMSQQQHNPHIPQHLVGQDGNIIQKPLQGGSNTNLSDNGASGSSGSSDPTMGLFTQESPQQEVAQNKSSNKISDDESPSMEPPLKIDDNTTVLHREAGDGAASQVTDDETSSLFDNSSAITDDKPTTVSTTITTTTNAVTDTTEALSKISIIGETLTTTTTTSTATVTPITSATTEHNDVNCTNENK
uniref:Vacuolar protein sorting-associated protein 26 n=1 Tax=Corethrella appendiculata TaxID=1370023 RepID=U5EWK8_9DIPT